LYAITTGGERRTGGARQSSQRKNNDHGARETYEEPATAKKQKCTPQGMKTRKKRMKSRGKSSKRKKEWRGRQVKIYADSLKNCERRVVLERLADRSGARSANVVVVKAAQWRG
jgi:hypothetical protein